VGELHRQDDTGTKALAKAPPEPQRFTLSSSPAQPQHAPTFQSVCHLCDLSRLTTEVQSSKLLTPQRNSQAQIPSLALPSAGCGHMAQERVDDSGPPQP